MAAKEPQVPATLFDVGSIDLAAAADKGADLHLVHPVKGTKTGVVINVLGSDSAVYRRNLRRMRDEVAASPEREPTDPDDAVILNNARLLAAAITGWSGLAYGGGGGALPFTTEAAVRIMVDRPWIADQVNSFRNQRENFFKD